jgi:RNA polymerase sigma-32 factor
MMKNSYQQEVALYIKQINRYPLLKLQEEIELGKEALKGSRKARDKLVTSNLRFVVQIANTYRNYTKTCKFSILDLIQEGNDGLVYAAEKYDVNKGYRFTTYAVWWIRARIMHFIIRTYSIVKVGTTAAERQLFFKTGCIKHLLDIIDIEERKKAREELAESLGLPVNEVTKMERRMSYNDISLEKTQDESGSFSLVDIISNKDDIRDTLEDRDFSEKLGGEIKRVVSTLSERERDILNRRWMKDRKQTLEEIAKTYKLSRERIRQIEHEAIGKVRKKLLDSQAGKEAVEHLGLNKEQKRL